MLLLLAATGGGLLGILPLILMIAALVFFLIATFWGGQPSPGWNRLVSAGLACWVLAVLIQMAGGV